MFRSNNNNNNNSNNNNNTRNLYNPFDDDDDDDDEDLSSSSSISKSSENSVDVSYDDDDDDENNDNDDNYHDNDEDSLIYHECYTEDLYDAQERAYDLLPGDKEEEEEEDITLVADLIKERPVDKGPPKRVAPLSFDVQTVLAKPALDFDKARIASYKPDFVSPLETALIDQVDHLKTVEDVKKKEISSPEKSESNGNLQQSMQPKGTLGSEERYFTKRLQAFSSYFGSSRTFFTRKGCETTIGDGGGDKKNNEEEEEDSHKMLEEQISEKSELDTVILKDPSSPLSEATDVLSRIDRVQQTLLQKNNVNTKDIPSLVDDKRVLKKIQMHSKESAVTIDHRHSASPWNRLIILEELGTASSWIILLLPYISFILAIGLDSKASLWETTSKAIRTNNTCLVDIIQNRSMYFPLDPIDGPCTYKLKELSGFGSESRPGSTRSNYNYLLNHNVTDGVVFSSGPMNDISLFTTFLYGDVMYSSLTGASVSFIADGFVEYSTVVLQQDAMEWLPVSVSKPQPLSMVCNRGESNSTSMDRRGSLWNCESPRLVDVLFSLPDTSILTGGAIRVDTIISHVVSQPMTSRTKLTSTTKPLVGSIIYSNNVSDKDELINADWSSPQEFLMEIAHSSSYKFTHSSELRTTVLIVVRIASLLFSLIFICFWFWCMGINGFFFIGDCSLCNWGRDSELSEEHLKLKKHRKEVLWWECPWILFPERRYLLFLLFALLLLQNPLLACMYFKPSMYRSTKLHIIADSLIGIGFHSVLCLWLCLIEGLRYHTATAARKRAMHLKEILELRRATQFLAKEGASKYNSIDSPSHHLTSYFDEFGDLHGSGPSAWMNLRLKHDPFGDGWADFLVPKLFLFIMGICTVIFTSYFRFFSTDVTNTGIFHSILLRFSIDPPFLKDDYFVFTISSSVQFIILALWALLIIRAAFKTGAILRKEPFLSTRPAQLAYRVLMSILVLGVTSFVLPFSVDLLSFFKEWSTMRNSASSIDMKGNATLIYETSSECYLNQNKMTVVKLMMTILLHATHRFPYCGTALSLEPGEIIYVTCVTMIVAFIFLPSTSYILDEDNQTVESKPDHHWDENQRRDKRDVLTMSKYTHTWRAFPMPIERHEQTIKNKVKSVESYQIGKNFENMTHELGRGTIFKCNYVPVFCVETALWLAECSWQTYYSSSEYKTDDFAPGVMNLDSVGLELEADIYNKKSDTRAFVASNIASQVDGESDSIIVIAFRGTCSSTNLKTDFNWGQEALPESFIDGTESRPQYQVQITKNMDAEAGYIYNTKLTKDTKPKAKGFIREADNILRSVPVTRLAYPCVHSGFIEAYNLLRDQIIQVLVHVIERQIKKAILRYEDEHSSQKESYFVLPKIYVTGHSLGGALAQLIALDIACNVEIKIEFPSVCLTRGLDRRESDGVDRGKRTVSCDLPLNSSERINDLNDVERRPLLRRHSFTAQSKSAFNQIEISHNSVGFVHQMLSGTGFASGDEKSISLRPPVAVYTFGQPRVGNHAFARFYKAHVPHTFRVVTEGDAITSLPLPTSCPPALYKHAGLEVILDEGSTGNILVGPTIVETLFRFSKVRTNMFAHLMEKYRDGLESALTHDELQEVYRTHGVDSRSFRNGYNTSDLLPDWVTHISRRNF
eukprot:CAMPEP_0176504310 /NCGR_PEP_ID=MMETSP0200_2-20121128/15861_1 /TAXON_ID=947934 /ORGANISM="Chaetoceros sp., Strain GSL56" /LENGTH=1635 /DNA_ID=CAMNT_0017903725 /DNA_START=200 /DNA_END=5107 /DNA_ORIENTATION=-